MGNVSLCWCCSPCCSVPLGVTYSVSFPAPGMVPAIDVYLLPPVPEDGSLVSLFCHAPAEDREKCLHLQARSDLPTFSSGLIHCLYTEVMGAQTYIPINSATGVMVSGRRWSRELGSAAPSMLRAPLVRDQQNWPWSTHQAGTEDLLSLLCSL